MSHRHQRPPYNQPLELVALRGNRLDIQEPPTRLYRCVEPDIVLLEPRVGHSDLGAVINLGEDQSPDTQPAQGNRVPLKLFYRHSQRQPDTFVPVFIPFSRTAILSTACFPPSCQVSSAGAPAEYHDFSEILPRRLFLGQRHAVLEVKNNNVGAEQAYLFQLPQVMRRD